MKTKRLYIAIVVDEEADMTKAADVMQDFFDSVKYDQPAEDWRKTPATFVDPEEEGDDEEVGLRQQTKKALTVKHFGPGPHANGTEQAVHAPIKQGERSGVAGLVSRALGMGPGLKKSLVAFERTAAQSDHEHGVFLDKHGNTLMAQSSTPNNPLEIHFNIPETAYLLLTAGDGVLTHNHPVIDAWGVKLEDQTLSVPDILLAAQLNLAEVRAVTKHHVYSFQRPNRGWPPKADVLKLAEALRDGPMTEGLIQKHLKRGRSWQQAFALVKEEEQVLLAQGLAQQLGASYSKQVHAYYRD